MQNIIVIVCLGVTLEGPNASEVWDPEHKNDDSDGANQHFGADQKLIIKMVNITISATKRSSYRHSPALSIH